MTTLIPLATAIGYTATLDTPTGGVQRVILDRPCAGSLVFNPVDDDGQAMVVLCWLLAKDRLRNSDCAHMVTRNDVGEYNVDADDFFAICRQPHSCTPASLRAAIVQAAGRVCS